MRLNGPLLACILAVVSLASCTSEPTPPPDVERYHCVPIPNGLVECSLRSPPAVP